MTGNATRIAKKLWQGSAPECGTPLREELGMDVLVLSAREHQLPADCFPGVTVIHAKLDDSGARPTEEEFQAAHHAARRAARLWLSGKRVLVTCQLGVNRSGLVTALVLYYGQGMSGREACALVKAGRVAPTPMGPMRALSNTYFAAHLNALPEPRGLTALTLVSSGVSQEARVPGEPRPVIVPAYPPGAHGHHVLQRRPTSS